MYQEDELVPISALQHVVFCDRQAALIHFERVWKDNAHTVEGHHLHEIAHSEGAESRGSLRIVRGLPLRSFTLGVVGIADVVEFHQAESGWNPFPIEYKKGRRKRHRADEVQLCAQAICLEEMLGQPIARGALFYGKSRRRLVVEFDNLLRNLTRDAAERFREIIESHQTPAAQFGPKCRDCSLIDICRPRASERSASRYVRHLFAASEVRI